jgi:hypothetical protein
VVKESIVPAAAEIKVETKIDAEVDAKEEK